MMKLKQIIDHINNGQVTALITEPSTSNTGACSRRIRGEIVGDIVAAERNVVHIE